MVTTKHTMIAEQIHQDIHDGEYSDRLPGVRHLATRYGVNFKTVNKAVSALVADGVLTERRGEGRFVAERRCDSGVVVAVGRTDGHLYERMTANLAKKLPESGYTPVIVDVTSLRGPADRADRFADLQPEALLVYGADDHALPTLQALRRRCGRMVVIGRDNANWFPAEPVVYCDQEQVTRLATEHLIRLGHKRIAHVTYPWRFGDAQLVGSDHGRGLKGYEDAMASHGLSAFASLIYMDRADEFPAVLQPILQDPSTRPTAMVAFMDFAAVHCMRVASAMGLSVPDDLAVVGLNNTPWCEWAGVPLTSVSLEEDELVRHAVSMLAGEQAGRQIAVAPRLVIRQSCGGKATTGGE